MTGVFETIKTDDQGNVLELAPASRPELRVTSDQIIPKGMGLGTLAFVIDKMDIAICDGKDNWYNKKDQPVAAGSPFSALFA
jgi:hypothetical protein